MTFLYCLTRLITIPGVVLRCLWEQIVCRITGTPVEDLRYIRADEMCSHVEHTLIKSPSGSFFIGFIPLLFNLFGGVMLVIVPAIFLPSGFYGSFFTGICLWTGFSLLCNLFPSVEDALNMKERLYGKGGLLMKIIFTPGFILMLIGAYLERYCLSFAAAAAVLVLVLI